MLVESRRRRFALQGELQLSGEQVSKDMYSVDSAQVINEALIIRGAIFCLVGRFVASIVGRAWLLSTSTKVSVITRDVITLHGVWPAF